CGAGRPRPRHGAGGGRALGHRTPHRRGAGPKAGRGLPRAGSPPRRDRHRSLRLPVTPKGGKTMALDAATLALVTQELRTTLLDAKIDKIFEPTRDEVLITLRTRTDTYRLLLSARSGSSRVCLTEESFENPLTPPGFC